MDISVTAVYDANILYPAPLRDLFIRLAHAGLVRARWTDAIHNEWIRNVIKDNPALSTDIFATQSYFSRRTSLQFREQNQEVIHGDLNGPVTTKSLRDTPLYGYVYRG